MKVALGSDHAGPDARRRIKERLQRAGHEVIDCGADGTASVDYPDFARDVARLVAGGTAERGILVCGTGIGMSIAANKVRGVRAAKCNDPEEARLCRAHNDANVLCLGARIVDPSVMDAMVDVFLAEPFEAGRHQRRVGKMMDIEDAPAP